jgi:hypothetical protein
MQSARVPTQALLASWIQSQHLSDVALSDYRGVFASHPANLLVLRNFLHEGPASRLAKFLAMEAEYETLYGLYSSISATGGRDASARADEWEAALERDRFFRLQKFVKISPRFKLTPNVTEYLRFNSAFNQRPFREFFEIVTGLELDLANSTYHAFMMQRGDFLKHHDDTHDEKYRLAFVLYLTQDWDAKYGGALNMIDPQGRVTSIEAEYNSLVLFKVNPRTKHFVAPVEISAGNKFRTTISGWMHRPQEMQPIAH